MCIVIGVDMVIDIEINHGIDIDMVLQLILVVPGQKASSGCYFTFTFYPSPMIADVFVNGFVWRRSQLRMSEFVLRMHLHQWIAL